MRSRQIPSPNIQTLPRRSGSPQTSLLRVVGGGLGRTGGRGRSQGEKCAKRKQKRKKRRRGGVGAGVSQGHGGAGVFELAGQHSSVQLVELHQVDQVGELGGAVVEAEEHLAVLLTLSHQADSGGEREREKEREGENNCSFTD